MANRFLSNLRINDAYTFPDDDGTVGQAIVTDGAGNLTFGTVAAGTADAALKITLTVKNVSGGTLNAGTLVRVAPTANPPSGNVLEVDVADNSSDSTMPAVGILISQITDGSEGDAVAFGRASGFSTSGYTEGDPIWVGSNGAFVGTKPTGSDLIQKIGQIIKVHNSNGSIEVFGAGRTNDVPNLPEGKIWVGDSNTTVSTIVHLDELNGRVGIGTDSPIQKMQIDGGSSNAYLHFSNTDTGLTVNDGSDIGVNESEDLVIWNREATNLRFATSNSERMRIDSSGNVLVGLTSRVTGLSGFTQFEVSGDQGGITINSNQTTANKYSRIMFTKNGATGNEGLIRYNVNDYHMAFWTDATERMRIDSSGNVGINQTNPLSKLHITNASGGSGGYLKVTDAVYSGDVRFGMADGINNDAHFGTWTNNNIVAFTNSVERMRIDSSGYTKFTKSTGGVVASFYDETYGVDLAATATGGSIQTFNLNQTLNFNTYGTGYITFTTSGTTERMRITSGGNVGIGTTSPNDALEIHGNLNIGDGTSVTSIGLQRNSANYITATDAAGYLVFRTGGENERMRITSSGLVGIGTPLPTSDLHISDAFPRITLQDTDGTNTAGYIDYSGDYLGFTSRNGSSNGNIRFRRYDGVTTSESMYIDSSGNVGIGTTTPAAKLEVYGSGSTVLDIQGSQGQLFSVDDDLTGTLFAVSDISGVPILSVEDTGEVLVDGNLGIGTASPSAKLEINVASGDGILIKSADVATLKFKGSGSVSNWGFASTKITAGDFGLYESNSAGGDPISNGTPRIMLKAGGNVGIGTTSPSAKLDIGGGDGTPAGTQFAAVIKGTGTRTLYLDSDSTTSSMWWGAGNTPHFAIDSQNGGGAAFWTYSGGWARRMDITSAGNVGIGTASPGATLHANVTGNNTVFRFTRDTGTNGRLDLDFDGANSNFNSLYGYTFQKNGTEHMRIDSSGYVGIGTTSPTHSLSVEGNTNGTSGIQTNNPSTGAAARSTVELRSDSAQLNIYATSAAYNGVSGWADSGVLTTSSDTSGGLKFNAQAGGHTFQTSTNTRMVINNSGNVGIGTTSPVTKLDIDGGSLNPLQVNSTQDYMIGLSRSGVSQWWLKAYTNGAFALHENGVGDKIYIAAGGNVGIGTTSPSVKLQANGNIRSHFDSTRYVQLESNTSGSVVKGVGGNGFFIRSYGESYFNGGNVGIGTASPVAGLHVYKNQNEPFVVESPNANTWMNLVSTDGNWSMGAANGNKWMVYQRTGNTATRMTIDSSGRVGIGTSSPTQTLHVNGNARLGRTSISTTSTSSELTVYLSGGGSPIEMNTASGTGAYLRAKDGSSGSQYWQWGTYAGTNYVRHFNGISTFVRHKMGSSSAVWDMSGNNNSQAFSSRYTFRNRSSNVRNIVVAQNYYASQKFISFLNDTSGYEIGRIMFNGTSNVTYSTSGSDIRLKENIQNWNEDISSKITALQPKTFTFKHDLEEEQQKGFIAQNEADNFPEAYPKDPEGYHTWNPSGMVVYLMKALKEQIDKTTELESRIEQLEAKI